MPKSPEALSMLPAIAQNALRKLGEDLALARVRRNESQRSWAKRLGVSVPTLIRLEQGDPGVGVGIVATALWMISRTDALADLAAPEHDRGALERDVQAALQRQRVRSRRGARVGSGVGGDQGAEGA
ncbi:XRE family transcriptional regulator [Leptothrix ochracea]|uniref:XRE family transcriptional regulator n=1 Tax=Leptothrix ochracea TaxID=735331 RepID=UPI0034E2E747